MRPAYVLLTSLLVAGGCHAGKKPELRVLGVHDAVAHEVVFVQVSNPAKQAMRLTKLAYTFAGSGGTVARGEVPLQRDVPAGAAVVVEVPLDSNSRQPMTLHGVLTAELDQVERTFPVEAQVKPARSDVQETSTEEAKPHPAPADGANTASDEATAQPAQTVGSDSPSEATPQPAAEDTPATSTEDSN